VTSNQKELLQTLLEHGGDVPAVSYRLTFAPTEQKWARESGFVERIRGSFRITDAGVHALMEAKQ
jgi:hypothetical protein